MANVTIGEVIGLLSNVSAKLSDRLKTLESSKEDSESSKEDYNIEGGPKSEKLPEIISFLDGHLSDIKDQNDLKITLLGNIDNNISKLLGNLGNSNTKVSSPEIIREFKKDIPKKTALKNETNKEPNSTGLLKSIKKTLPDKQTEKKPRSVVEKATPVIVNNFSKSALNDISSLITKPTKKEDKPEKQGGVLDGIKKLIGPAILVLGGLGALVAGLMTDGPLTGFLKILSKGGISGGIKMFSSLLSKQIAFFTKGLKALLPEKLLTDIVSKAKGFLSSIGKFLLKPFSALGGKAAGSGIFKTLTSLFGKLLKPVLKRIPGIGSLISWAFAVKRFKNGQLVRGLIDVASGIASLFPGPGTLISIGLDVLNAFLDFKASKEEKITGEGEAKNSFGDAVKSIFGKYIKPILKRIPGIGTLLSFADGYKKFKEGNIIGGLLNVVSGIATMIPGVGTAISIGLDILNSFLDKKSEENDKKKGSGFSLSKFFGKIKDKLLNSFPLKNLFMFWGGIKKVFKGDFKEGFKQMAFAIPFVKPLSDWLFGSDEEKDKESEPPKKKSIFTVMKEAVLKKLRAWWQKAPGWLKYAAEKMLPDHVVKLLNDGKPVETDSEVNESEPAPTEPASPNPPSVNSSTRSRGRRRSGSSSADAVSPPQSSATAIETPPATPVSRAAETAGAVSPSQSSATAIETPPATPVSRAAETAGVVLPNKEQDTTSEPGSSKLQKFYNTSTGDKRSANTISSAGNLLFTKAFANQKLDDLQFNRVEIDKEEYLKAKRNGRIAISEQDGKYYKYSRYPYNKSKLLENSLYLAERKKKISPKSILEAGIEDPSIIGEVVSTFGDPERIQEGDKYMSEFKSLTNMSEGSENLMDYIKNKAIELIKSGKIKELEDIKNAAGGASNKAKPKLLKNFDFIDGKSEPIIMNDEEKLFKDVKGKFDAILNKKQLDDVDNTIQDGLSSEFKVPPVSLPQDKFMDKIQPLKSKFTNITKPFDLKDFIKPVSKPSELKTKKDKEISPEAKLLEQMYNLSSENYKKHTELLEESLTTLRDIQDNIINSQGTNTIVNTANITNTETKKLRVFQENNTY
jgi:hypothetical protein